MNLRQLTCFVLALPAAVAAPAALAQQRHVVIVPEPSRQAPPPGVATFGLPNPAGLTPPMPGSLTPPMAPSLVPPTPPNIASPGVAPGSPAIDAGIAAPTTTGGV